MNKREKSQCIRLTKGKDDVKGNARETDKARREIYLKINPNIYKLYTNKHQTSIK